MHYTVGLEESQDLLVYYTGVAAEYAARVVRTTETVHSLVDFRGTGSLRIGRSLLIPMITIRGTF